MKKLMKILLAIGFLTGLASASAFANPLENKNAIGVYFLASETAVGGIQYERQFSDLISTKFDVFLYYSANYGESFEYNFNTQVDFTLYESLWKERYSSKLYAYVLAGALGDVTDSRSLLDAVVSAGFGFDFVLFDHLSIPVQFGFMGSFPNNKNVGFCAGSGLRYSF